MSDSETFKVSINGAAPFDFVGSTGMYRYAALQAVLADPRLLPLPERHHAIEVKIWCEPVLPGGGPFHYLIHEGYQYGEINVLTAIPRKQAGLSSGPPSA